MWILPKNLNIYHSVQGMGGLISDSQELSLQLELSVLWRSKPSPSKTWLRRLNRDNLTPRLFSQILKSSLGNSIMEKWISSVEASLVNHLVPQEDVMEAKTLDTSGPTSLEASENWDDLPLFSSRTWKESFPANSNQKSGQIQREHQFCSMSSESWKDWVIKQRREYSQRLKLERHTKGSEFLFLVSEMTSESREWTLYRQCSEVQEQMQNWHTLHQEAQSSTHGSQEELQWATPNTMDHLPQRSKEALIRQATTVRKGRTAPANLREQVNPEAVQVYKQTSQWATPMAGTKNHMGSSLKYYQRRLRVGKQVDLNGQVMLEKQTSQWATPISRNWCETVMNHQIANRKDGKTRLDTMPRQVHHEEGYKGKLNPRWVETLMGLPVGWAMPSCQNPVIIEQMSFDYLEMESFLPQQSEHLEPSGNPYVNNQVEDMSSLTKTPWPTPNARDFKDSINTVPPSVTVTRGYSLGQAVAKENIKSWSTPPASQRGEDLDHYLSRMKSRIRRGFNQPFSPTLQIQVEAAERGVDLKEELEKIKEGNNG